MNSVQENKNELEAAVRYCESAISRAQATIESMEFRQQAASKAWHEQTGREESLTKKLAFMTEEYDRMKGYADKLLDENGTMEAELEERISEVADLKVQIEGHRTNMALLTDELEEQRASASVEALQIALSEKDQTIALQRDQIAMFQRKMSRMNEVNR